ncbi:NADH-ubiquinone oxidoreductase [Macleaya cordata]|uniref:NADH-ubiquinone oxidoreductase n=1 Tax=Macleaya cordata TaxID=56857 RepID=A0A200QFY2_MACCD|nr:NADH-ubiquinone oxidoreductase [Macleaya cordata]
MPALYGVVGVCIEMRFGVQGGKAMKELDPFDRSRTKFPPYGRLRFPMVALALNEMCSENIIQVRISEFQREERGVVFDESPPDDFDPADPYKDPVAMLEMREHIVREKWIDIETAKILREKLKWCYRIEGINHLQKCKHLVQQYLESTRGIGWGKDARPPCFHAPKPAAAAADDSSE